MKKSIILLTFIFLFFVLIFSLVTKHKLEFASPQSPSDIVLWAWERPENLNFLKNTGDGVAFLAGSIEFRKNLIKTIPRLQPLSVDNRTPMTAVIRIDNIEHRDTNFTDKDFTTITDFIVHICSNNSKVTHCQIDFDALESEREFYKRLLTDVRIKLPEQMQLSITALVSWCHSGGWLDDLPIIDAVPMFFQLGVDEYVIRNDMISKSFMQSKMCQKSVGVSTDEPLPDAKFMKNRMIYIFNSEPWTQGVYRRMIDKVTTQLSE